MIKTINKSTPLVFFICLMPMITFADEVAEEVFNTAVSDNRKFHLLSTKIEQCIIKIQYKREVKCTEWNEAVRHEWYIDVRELQYKKSSQKGADSIIFDFENQYSKELSKLKEETDRVLGLVLKKKWKGEEWTSHTSKLSRATMEKLGIKTTFKVHYCKGNIGFIDNTQVRINTREAKKPELVSTFQKLKKTCQ